MVPREMLDQALEQSAAQLAAMKEHCEILKTWLLAAAGAWVVGVARVITWMRTHVAEVNQEMRRLLVSGHHPAPPAAQEDAS